MSSVFAQDYCMPKSSWDGADHFAIDSVTFADLTGYQVGSGFDYPIETPATVAPNKPQSYTTLFSKDTAKVIAGTTYTLTVSREHDDPPPMVRFAWIDWNKNGSFDDEGEEYMLSDGTSPNLVERTVTKDITIPENASGTVRMRVRMIYHGIGNTLSGMACDSIHFAGGATGETEDYLLNVTNGTTNIFSKKDQQEKVQLKYKSNINQLEVSFKYALQTNALMSIYNMNGSLIKTIQINKGATDCYIDVNNFQSGIYYIFIDNNKIQPLKFVKN